MIFTVDFHETQNRSTVSLERSYQQNFIQISTTLFVKQSRTEIHNSLATRLVADITSHMVR
jgi:hypothetical protein